MSYASSVRPSRAHPSISNNPSWGGQNSKLLSTDLTSVPCSAADLAGRPTSSPYLPSRCPTSSPRRSYTSIIPHRPPFCQYISVLVALPAEVSTGVVLWLFNPPRGVKNNYNAAPYVAGLAVAWCCISSATRSTRVGSGLTYVCCISSVSVYNTLPRPLPVLHHATHANPRRTGACIHGVTSCCISVLYRATRSCCILYYQYNYRFYFRTYSRVRIRAWPRVYDIKELDNYGNEILDKMRLCVL